MMCDTCTTRLNGGALICLECRRTYDFGYHSQKRDARAVIQLLEDRKVGAAEAIFALKIALRYYEKQKGGE